MCQAWPALSSAWMARARYRQPVGKPISGTEVALVSTGRLLLVTQCTRSGPPPMHPLRPHRDAALLAGCALEQRQVEVAAFEIALQRRALVGACVEPQGRM